MGAGRPVRSVASSAALSSVVVPSLSPNPRAAKVVILKEASHFCYQLTADSKSLQQESNILERERERLLARVSYLRKQVASMRMGC